MHQGMNEQCIYGEQSVYALELALSPKILPGGLDIWPLKYYILNEYEFSLVIIMYLYALNSYSLTTWIKDTQCVYANSTTINIWTPTKKSSSEIISSFGKDTKQFGKA